MKCPECIRKLISPTNIFESIVVLRWFLYFMGMMYFHRNSKNQQSSFALALSSGYYIIFLTSFVMFYTNPGLLWNYVLKNELLWNMPLIMFSVATMVCVTIVFVVSLVKRKSSRKIMILIMRLDIQMKSISIRMNYKRFFWTIVFSILSILVYQNLYIGMTTIMIAMTVTPKIEHLLYIVALLLPSFYDWCFTLKFGILSYVMKHYLKEVNLVWSC